MVKNILVKLGLAEKEAQIYKVALESGPETVQKIAQRAEITRTGAYAYIKSLMSRGLMSSSTRDKKTYFLAESPESLSSLLDSRKKEVQRLIFEFKKTMPQLRTLFETNEERPQVRVFEGKDGFKTMTNDLLKSKFQALEEFTSVDEIYTIYPTQQEEYREKLAKKFKKARTRIIYTSNNPVLNKLSRVAELRFLSKEKFPFVGSMNIYGNKVALTSHKKTTTGVIIENKEIAETMRAIFNLAWESLDKKIGAN